MPTDTLNLLHSLLSTLDIPITPPTLSSIPPLLILLTLETILSEKLPIPPEIRSCRTQENTLGLIKILLGILSDDLLGMDLSVINPTRVLEGSEREMEVLVMGLVVVAKKKGIGIDLSGGRAQDKGREKKGSINSCNRRKNRYGFTEEDDEEKEEDDSLESLQQPLKPDISFSTPSSSTTPQLASMDDVFGINGDISMMESTSNSENIPYSNHNHDPTVYEEIYQEELLQNKYSSQLEDFNDMNDDISRISDEFDPYQTPIHETFPFNREQSQIQEKKASSVAGGKGISLDTSHSHSYSTTTTTTLASSSTSGKTVLQYMLEEFGLDPG